jgi:hypothetical protein
MSSNATPASILQVSDSQPPPAHSTRARARQASQVPINPASSRSQTPHNMSTLEEVQVQAFLEAHKAEEARKAEAFEQRKLYDKEEHEARLKKIQEAQTPLQSGVGPPRPPPFEQPQDTTGKSLEPVLISSLRAKFPALPMTLPESIKNGTFDPINLVRLRTHDPVATTSDERFQFDASTASFTKVKANATLDDYPQPRHWFEAFTCYVSLLYVLYPQMSNAVYEAINDFRRDIERLVMEHDWEAAVRRLVFSFHAEVIERGITTPEHWVLTNAYERRFCTTTTTISFLAVQNALANVAATTNSRPTTASRSTGTKRGRSETSQRREACNLYNDGRCTFSAEKCKRLHVCSTCMQASHRATACTRKVEPTAID